MTSRSLTDLIPELAKRAGLAIAEYEKLPGVPRLIVTCTLRTSAEQDALYAQGRTKPGSVVTNARGGQSLHNHRMALDVAFLAPDGRTLDWTVSHFERFAAIAKRYGLAWGGDWRGFRDCPHFEVPGMSWQDAQAGKQPVWPPLPGGAEPKPKPAPAAAPAQTKVRLFNAATNEQIGEGTLITNTDKVYVKLP